MTTTPTPPSERAHGPGSTASTLAAAVAVLFVDGEGIDAALEGVERQVYEPAAIVVVGGGDQGREAAEGHEVLHVPTLAEYVATLGADIDVVWVLHGDARPRPDALGWLIAELERNDASLVGSKVLDADHPGHLESVGSATDVFGEPYSGLDPGEVDLEQYDVVRDVAFVSGVSALIRRDLLRGLRGLDRALPPVAAGMDLSQRARLAGGRVMVAPSSEVIHARRCGHGVEGWRELAGRMRAMLKAYRPVTLAWLVPIATLLGFFDALVRVFLGQVRPLADLVRAGGWNLIHLPSTISARRALRPVRAVGDEELFRYQVEGSVRLRALGSEIAERLGWVIDEEPAVVSEEELGIEVGRTGPVVAGLVVLLLGLASRRLWFGSPPQVGFSLPAAADAWSVLSSYAGGWNPAGLGSPEPLHPAPAAVAVLQVVVGSWAQPLLALLSGLLGIAGTARLLFRLGVSSPVRYLAGLVLVLGPFGLLLAGATSWAGMMAVGGVPWLVHAALAPWPDTWRLRLGRIGVMAAASTFAAFAPLVGATVLVAVLVGWLVLRPGWTALVRGVVASALSSLVAGSYLYGVAPGELLAGGPDIPSFPSIIASALVVVAGVAAVVSVPTPRWQVAGWGSILVATALVGVAWAPDGGGEVAVAAALLGSLGAAVAVGAALSFEPAEGRVRTGLRAVATLAAIGAVGVTLVTVPGGRAGLPPDQWEGRLDFVASLAPASGPGRVLVAGLPESLPGEHRTSDGYAYRLIWGDRATLDQARLPDPRLGEASLADTLERIGQGDQVRPGALLGEYAIRWIMVLDQVPLQQALRAQVDLAEIPVQPGVSVFENLAARPRADATGVGTWTATRAAAFGPAGEGTVRFADNASPRWSPGWSQAGWANRLSVEDGEILYIPEPVREVLALAGLAAVLGGLVLVVGSRPWR